MGTMPQSFRHDRKSLGLLTKPPVSVGHGTYDSQRGGQAVQCLAYLDCRGELGDRNADHPIHGFDTKSRQLLGNDIVASAASCAEASMPMGFA